MVYARIGSPIFNYFSYTYPRYLFIAHGGIRYVRIANARVKLEEEE